MSLNKNDLLSSVPHIDIQRSRFNRSFKHTTTANAGMLVPFLIDDLNPGTTVNFDTSFVSRMLTPLKPVMDDAYLDLFFFFVPYRILWDHWREFMGENTSGYWTQPVQYQLPHLFTTKDTSDPTDLTGTFQPGSLADHFGFPTLTQDIHVSQMPFRAYVSIWNDFFRNQNTDSPAYIYTGDNDLNHSSTYETYALYGGDMLPVSRMHDYFSDCLPTSQKLTNPAGIPWPDTVIPVGTNWRQHDYYFSRPTNPPAPYAASTSPLIFGDGSYSPSTESWLNPAGITNDNVVGSIYANKDGRSIVPSVSATADTSYITPTNLWAFPKDAENPLLITINSLRQAFAIQRYGERLAYGGSRYIEQLQTFYGLSPQDARLQRPEFLGSQRFVINMSQVLQTSETSTTPQGNTAAYSLTGGTGAHVSYSTQEHGILMGLFCIRHDRSYQQGINRQWSRRDLYDFYQPTFANLGNMAVKNKEIYAGTSSDDDVFGYQEAWAEYRYLPNIISGDMRSNAPLSLDVWHYGDDYNQLPTLSQGWMAEGHTEIARTLAVQDPSELGDQFLIQLHSNIDTVAPMPLYSVPGLIDHF